MGFSGKGKTVVSSSLRGGLKTAGSVAWSPIPAPKEWNSKPVTTTMLKLPSRKRKAATVVDSPVASKVPVKEATMSMEPKKALTGLVDIPAASKELANEAAMSVEPEKVSMGPKVSRLLSRRIGTPVLLLVDLPPPRPLKFPIPARDLRIVAKQKAKVKG